MTKLPGIRRFREHILSRTSDREPPVGTVVVAAGWPSVIGQRKAVIGSGQLRSVVNGQWSAVSGQRSAVSGQRSVVSGQSRLSGPSQRPAGRVTAARPAPLAAVRAGRCASRAEPAGARGCHSGLSCCSLPSLVATTAALTALFWPLKPTRRASATDRCPTETQHWPGAIGCCYNWPVRRRAQLVAN